MKTNPIKYLLLLATGLLLVALGGCFWRGIYVP